MKRKYVMAVASAAVVVGCATYVAPTREESMQVVKSSFRERGIAKMDRLDQSDLQVACSEAALTGKEVSKDVRARLEKQALATVKLPPDGVYLGDFKQGERIAQTGVGLQWSDTANQVNGGNCYACHQITKAEVSFGTLGPSLGNYGKIRDFDPADAKALYEKIYNSNAVFACSTMPRFGANKILTVEQIKDIVALLMSRESPVNTGK